MALKDTSLRSVAVDPLYSPNTPFSRSNCNVIAVAVSLAGAPEPAALSISRRKF